MNKRILLVFGFIFILLGCDQGIEKEVKKEIGYGVIKDGQYQNSYFGMTVKVPEGWSVQSQAQLDEISETGADIIAGDDENLKGALKVSQKQSVNLFAFFKFEQGAPVDSNPSIIAVAERVASTPGIKRGADYLFHTKKILQSGQLKLDFPGENYTADVSGVEFDIMPLTMEFGGPTINQEYYAAKFDDYVLAFVLTYTTQAELEELNAHISKFSFVQ